MTTFTQRDDARQQDERPDICSRDERSVKTF
jgi:hypothetical protein